MKGDLLHTKNNITLRRSSNHHKTLIPNATTRHLTSFPDFHYSKLVTKKGQAFKRPDGWPVFSRQTKGYGGWPSGGF